MALEIPLIRQEPKSDDCLRCCALMVFKYFGGKTTKEEIWKKLHVYKKHSGLYGSYIQDLGRIALKMGFRPTIYHASWRWWNQETVKAASQTGKHLISTLKNLKKQKRKWSDKSVINKDILYTKAGGVFVFQLPKLTTVDFYLQKKIPVILLVRAEAFYKDPTENYTHAILVVGKNENKYFLKDPYLAYEDASEEELLYAWSQANGWMIAIEPGPSKNKILQEKLMF